MQGNPRTRSGPAFRVLPWLLALALVPAAAPEGPAPARADVPGVVYNSGTGHWYKYVAINGTWAQADAGAQSLGGYLATLTSSAENDWVINVLGIGGNSCWIGGTDSGSEGTWRWISGETWSWTNWNNLEPNNSGGAENWLMMYTSGKWNDVYASYTLPGYVVEWNEDPNTPPPPVVPADPTNLTASLTVSSTVTLQWQDKSDNETKFEIERRTPSEAYVRIGQTPPNATTFEDINLEPQTEFTYRVRAVNGVGPSGYTNEASVTTGAFIPSPASPSDLQVVAATTTSMDVSWTDNSNGEVGFEVHRSVAGGPFQYRSTTGPNVATFFDTGLTPDAEYGYAVRAVGTLQTSGFVYVTGATLPTLSVTTLRGDLKDSTKFGKDLLKVTASWSYLQGASDGEADPVAEGITVRAGTDSAPVVLKLPPFVEGWKGKGAKWKWKSAKGSVPKYQVSVDLEGNLVTAVAKGVELTVPAANPMRVSVAIGDDGGTETREWPASKKAGVFKLR